MYMIVFMNASVQLYNPHRDVEITITCRTKIVKTRGVLIKDMEL